MQIHVLGFTRRASAYRPAARWALALTAAALIAAGVSCRREGNAAKENALTGKLIVFHAGSLSVPLDKLAEAFQKEHPGVQVLPEAAGSAQCARKVLDLHRDCDVLASADRNVISALLMPEHAAYNISFARNEMVIAYTPNSRQAATVTNENWTDVLTADGVVFGRSDPALDPCGYRTLMVFQLAERHYRRPGLAEKLRSAHAEIRPKETDLLSLLEVGEIDYMFIYRSVARQHNLKMVELPPEINLGSQDLAETYRNATVTLRGKPGEPPIVLRGEPMVYSVTILRNAPHRGLAEAFVAMLLSDVGRTIFRQCGQPSIAPARAAGYENLPASLKPLCRKALEGVGPRSGPATAGGPAKGGGRG